MRPKSGDRGPSYELGRRMAAARVYRDLNQADVAEKLGIKPDTLGRYERGFIGGDVKREGLIQSASEKLSLPRAFFVIDLQALPEMVEAEKLVRVMTPSEQRELEARALEQDLDDSTPLSDPNESRNGEQEPESGTQ